MKNMIKYDFAVIGAGVSGAWLAYNLAKYKLNVCLIEKSNDVAMGATKANSAIIHAGYDAKNGTLMAKLNVRGNEIIRNSYEKMAIPFKKIGSVVVAFSNEELETIKELYQRGINNGIAAEDMELWDEARIKKEEPNISEKAVGALYAKNGGIASAFELCIAAAEIAVKNGVDFYDNFEVTNIDDNFVYAKDGRKINANYIINAAGVHADEIAKMMGDFSFNLIPRKGEYGILDTSLKGLVNHIIFQTPVKYGKGVLVSPTVDDNILVGPTADNIEDKEDKATTDEGLKQAFSRALKSIPCISEKDMITSFTGIRPISGEHDFILGFSDSNPRLINVAGIESPGLTAAPAIGEYIIECIKEKGIEIEEKESFDDTRTVIRFNKLSNEQKNIIIKNNPLYGRIICRCETITEGEIVDSINRTLGAKDVDAVKRRVRAGLGRCQGGFCSPKVVEILARELKIDKTQVTKFGGGSWIVTK